MESGKIQAILDGETPVIGVTGYFTKETGDALTAVAEQHARDGRLRVVVELTKCGLINSPGVVALMNLAIRFKDDYKGSLILVGVHEPMTSVLKIVGVPLVVEMAGTVEEGLKLAMQAG